MRSMPRGFSLLEVVIVVAMVALLSTLAYASYSSFVSEARHKEATSALRHLMQKQEKYKSENGGYTGDLSNLPGISGSAESESGAYELSAGTCDDGAPQADCVKLTAKPSDGNGPTFHYNSRGVEEPVDKWE